MKYAFQIVDVFGSAGVLEEVQVGGEAVVGGGGTIRS